jgi:TRAP-type mannitol/chloroaromatic compound transport system substrate-binding protein
MKTQKIMVLAIIIGFIGMMLILGWANKGEAAEKVYKFKMQISAPSGTPYWDCALDFAKAVKESSGGRIIIDVKPGGGIVPAHEVTDAVRDGVLDIANPNSAMDLGRIGPKVLLLGSSGFPAGPTFLEYVAWMYKGGGLEIANELYKGYNAVVLGVATPTPAELFCHSNKPLATVADLKGTKFRTMGLWAEILQSFGCSVITVSGGEIYQAQERGVIDAFEYCGPGVDWKMGFHEVTKYIGVPGIHSPLSSNLVLVYKKSWEKLPDDLKALLKREVYASTLTGYLTFAMDDVSGWAEYEKHGTKKSTVSPELQKQVAEASKKLCDKYSAKDPMFKKIYEHQREFIKKWRATFQVLNPSTSLFDMP